MAGYAAELVEARPDWPVTGAAITMHANGVRALRRLGLGSGLQTVAAELPTRSFHDARGDGLCAMDLTDLWSGNAVIKCCASATNRCALSPRQRIGERFDTSAGDHKVTGFPVLADS